MGWVNPTNADPLTALKSVIGNAYYDCSTLAAADQNISELSARLVKLRMAHSHPDYVGYYATDIDRLLSRREYLRMTADTAEDPHA